MAKKKSNVFRPAILDESGTLRKKFVAECKRSGMTRAGFARRVIEVGISVVAEQAAAIDAEVQP